MPRTEWVHTLWPMKFCPKAGAGLFSLTCKFLQGKKISSDHQNNIMVKSTDSNIILNCQIKTYAWVALVDFLQETSCARAQLATAPCRKTINNVELSHPSESIIRVTTKAMGIQVTSTFMPCEDCALRKPNSKE